jgi:hypothetical protein
METIDPSFDTTTLCTLCVVVVVESQKEEEGTFSFFVLPARQFQLIVCLSLCSLSMSDCPVLLELVTLHTFV